MHILLSHDLIVFCIFSAEKVAEKLENLLAEDKVEVVYFLPPIRVATNNKSHVSNIGHEVSSSSVYATPTPKLALFAMKRAW